MAGVLPDRCETVHEALSARLDGEIEPIPAAVTERHLERCGGCRRYSSELSILALHGRNAALEPVPDLSGPILSRAAEIAGPRRRRLVVHREHRLGRVAGRSAALRSSVLRSRVLCSSALRSSALRWSVPAMAVAAVPVVGIGALGHAVVVPAHTLGPCMQVLAHLKRHP
jgi:anti-sigma factor RsiW